MTNTITLDGRKFVGLTQDTTASQDDYIHGHLRQAGAMDLVEGDPGGAEAMLTKILLSGRKHFIVAGALTEEGKIWNWQDADANAARFSKITEAAEKKAMQTCIVMLVIGFFTRGETSSEASPASSNGSEKSPRAKSAAQTSGTSRKT